MITQMRRNTRITPKEAAILLDVTPRTVAKWCREGKLSAVKIGRVWRVWAFDGQPVVRADG